MTSEAHGQAARAYDRAPEILTLTAWRGIAAVTVATHNFFNRNSLWHGWNIDRYTRWFHQGHLFVDFFFLLSGYILSYIYFDRVSSGLRPGVYRNYIIARFARIYPVHVFMAGAFLSIELMRVFVLSLGVSSIQPAFESPNSLKDLFMSLTFLTAFSSNPAYIPYDGPAWSIGAEWWCYLLVPFGLLGAGWMLRRRRWIRALIGAALSVVLAAALYRVYLIQGSLDVAGLPGTARCFTEMSFGILLYTFGRNVGREAATWMFLTGIVWCAIGMHAFTFEPLVLPAFALIICGSPACDPRFTRVFRSGLLVKAGRLSFSLYMVHYFVKWVMKYVSNFLHLSIYHEMDPSLVAVYYLVFIVSSIALSIPLYHFIEEPMRRRIRRLTA